MQLAIVEPETTEVTAIEAVETNPVVVFTDPERRERFYEDIKAEVRAFDPDTSTAKGRDAIRALAFKVTKCKTGIDKAGLKLTEDARAQIEAVNAARKDIRERLDALADEARRPLTEWEEAEAARKARVEALFASIKALSVVGIDATAASVGEQIVQLDALVLSKEDLDDRFDEADDARSDAAGALERIQDRLTKEEADKAELERLRAEAEQRRLEDEARAAAEAERVRQEQEAREQAEAAERAEREEAERLARIEREAAERAQREAEEKARAEQAEKDRQHEAQIAELNRKHVEEKRRADEAEAARKAEAERLEAERLEQERQAAAARAAEEKRQADQKHRAAIMKAAKEALMQHADIPEDVAKRVVLAITGGSVPAVSIHF